MISKYKLSKPCKVCGCEYQYQSRAACVECHKKKTKQYYSENKDRCKLTIKAWAKSNTEYRKLYRRAYYENNGV